MELIPSTIITIKLNTQHSISDIQSVLKQGDPTSAHYCEKLLHRQA